MVFGGSTSVHCERYGCCYYDCSIIVAAVIAMLVKSVITAIFVVAVGPLRIRAFLVHQEHGCHALTSEVRSIR